MASLLVLLEFFSLSVKMPRYIMEAEEKTDAA
jgi:hypothetical protein